MAPDEATAAPGDTAAAWGDVVSMGNGVGGGVGVGVGLGSGVGALVGGTVAATVGAGVGVGGSVGTIVGGSVGSGVGGSVGTIVGGSVGSDPAVAAGLGETVAGLGAAEAVSPGLLSGAGVGVTVTQDTTTAIDKPKRA